MSHDTHVLDLLPAYALGSLDPDEASRVEQHLSSCVICRKEAGTFQGVAEQLSFAAPAQTASPDLKDRLMQRIQVERPQPHRAARRTRLERFLPVWGLASLCLIVALAGLNVFLWQRFGQQEIFASRGGMRTAPLSAPDFTSQATGFVLISQDGDSGALVVDGLPPLDNGRQYQLWLTRDGQRTSGAIFSTDETSYATARIHAPESLLEYSAADITIEPSGGSLEPTGVKVLGGSLLKP